MPARTISVDFLTSSYRVVGNLAIANSGVMGVLSDSTCSYLEVRNANMARIHMANKLVEQAAVVRVVKQQVIAICMARREDVAIPRPGYARTNKYPLRLTTPIYELEGTFEWPGRFDFTLIMSDGANEFVPMYDASLGAILFPSLLIQSPVILVNRSYVISMVQVNE
ncbi:MAG: hypothetical protein EHM70_19100 [Chloroflexota bacterium]|nr:MAG: hypothetical protein EHM70_19100 [Chloroflexota bacterium]